MQDVVGIFCSSFQRNVIIYIFFSIYGYALGQSVKCLSCDGLWGEKFEKDCPRALEFLLGCLLRVT